MARIVDYATTIYTAVTANMVLNMPTHATGDLLVACLNKDTSGAFNTLSGWYAATTVNGTGHSTGIYTKRAASAAETATFTLSSETCIGVVISIRGQYWDGSTTDGSDAIDQKAATAADDSSLPFTGMSATTTQNNELIIHCLGGDAVYGTFALPGIIQLFGGDTGANSIVVGYDFKKTAGAIYVPSFFAGTAADDTRGLVITIKDDTNNTAVSPYVSNSNLPATLMSVLSNNVSTVNRGALKTVAPLDIATVGAKTLTYIAYTTNSADVGYNPFHGVLRYNATSSTTVLYGQELTFTSAENFTLGSGILFGMWQFTAPRDYLDAGISSTGGVLVGIADAENDYKFWTIGAQLAKTTKPWDMQNFAIQVNGSSDTSYATSGSIAYSTINDIYFAAQGYYGACNIDMSQLWLLNETQILGGTSANKLTFDDLVVAINKGCSDIPLIQVAGSTGMLWTRIKFGGADATFIGCNLNVFQYPRKADEINYLDFHVDNNHVGFEFYGLSGDNFTFTNCVFTSASSYYWRFNASHNSGATLNFAGSSVVNATVTLQSTVSLDRITFIDCATFTQNGATITNSSFSNTKVSSAQPGDADNISSTTFTKTTGTQHAIEIGGTAANITLTGLTFTGYAASNGSTGNEAIFVNIASGSMTITISGGTTPSIRTAGATVTVQNPVALTLTGLSTGSDISILTAGTTTELVNVQSNSGSTYAYNYQYVASTYIDIGVFKAGYIPFYIRNYLLSATNGSVPISQVIDRAYLE